MKIEEPGTVYVGWEELKALLGAYGFSRWECERLREAGLIAGRVFPPVTRAKYDWRAVLAGLELEEG